jgi:16S rRNA processing protein RimM
MAENIAGEKEHSRGAQVSEDGLLPTPGEPVFLVVGKLRRPHGVRGEMILEVYTDFPERLRTGSTVFVGEEHQPRKIRSRRRYSEDLLLALEGCTTPEEAGELRNTYLYVRSDLIPPLPEGEFYHHQLLGLCVVSDEGRYLGRLTQILETGANDVYVIQPESGKEILLPAVDSVILSVELPRGEIRVHLIPGILPD